MSHSTQEVLRLLYQLWDKYCNLIIGNNPDKINDPDFNNKIEEALEELEKE